MENELLNLIKKVFKMDSLHHEYVDNDTSYVVDTQKDGDVLTITIKLNENKDKKDFESWVESLDDEIFSEAYNLLSKDFTSKEVNELYNSESYSTIVNAFKACANKVVCDKIQYLNNLLKH